MDSCLTITWQSGGETYPCFDEEMLERTDAKTLRYLPGSSWAYSNIGYLYVRRLIERVADEALGAALRRLVLRPLELNRVWLDTSHEDLIDVEMEAAEAYDPRWVYHGLLVGPLHEAAFLRAIEASGRSLRLHVTEWLSSSF